MALDNDKMSVSKPWLCSAALCRIKPCVLPFLKRVFEWAHGCQLIIKDRSSVSRALTANRRDKVENSERDQPWSLAVIKK